MKLYTWTPNPALDLSGHVKDIVPNEKNYVFASRRDPGGNGINAARIAVRLGADVETLGFLGGATGQEVLDLLHHENIQGHFTPIRGMTRTNVTVTDDSHHRQTRLTFPGPQIRPSEIQSFMGAVRRLKGPGILIIGGSLPPGCPDGLHRDVAQWANRRGLGVVVDVPSKFMPPVLNDKNIEILMMKPNLTELAEWINRPIRTDAQTRAAVLQLAQRVGIAIVSLGKEGAYFAVGNHLWKGVSPIVKIRGTVGAGDSMVGTLCTRLLHHQISDLSSLRVLLQKPSGQKTLETIFRWGLAAGAATAGAEGTTLGRAAEIKRLVPLARVRKV